MRSRTHIKRIDSRDGAIVLDRPIEVRISSIGPYITAATERIACVGTDLNEVLDRLKSNIAHEILKAMGKIDAEQ